MIYEFVCKNEECENVDSYMVPIARLEEVAANPCSKCGSKTSRRYANVGIIIKNDKPAPTRMNKSFVHKGEEVKFGFANQGGRDGLQKGSIANKMKGARVDEKSGRIVVDVVSSHPDPLGKLEKVRSETTKKQIGQKVKRRK